MKVFVYGNILNNAYNLTRFLRAKGIDAEMFLDDSAPSAQNYPWWEHAELSPTQLPEWIHYHHVTTEDFIVRSAAFMRMARAFAVCDVALVCHWGPILAEAAGVPSMFFSYGGDLMVAHTRRELGEMFRRLLAGNMPGIRGFLVGLRQRRALQHSTDVVGVGMGWQIDNYVKPLGLLPKMVKTRLAWDVDAYMPEVDAALNAQHASFDVVYFMLARHSWRSVWNDLKGNDKFIRAYARLVHDRAPNVKLIMIEKGPDVDASKQLVDQLGIAHAVEWVREMPKDRLRAYYSLPNVVVVDQFWDDRWRERYPADITPRIGFGSGSVEAMCANRPLITAFFEQEFYEGATPPILAAFREDEILAQLHLSLDLGVAGRAAMGERGHAFVRRYHDWRVTTDLYIDQLRAIVAGRPQSEPEAERSPLSAGSVT